MGVALARYTPMPTGPKFLFGTITPLDDSEARRPNKAVVFDDGRVGLKRALK